MNAGAHLVRSDRSIRASGFPIVAACGGISGALAQGNSLPSRNDGAAKTAITGFVARVTTQGGADFVRPAERIAVFDNDGTLWETIMERNHRKSIVIAGLCALAISAAPREAIADASGVSFWLPGTFGSLAATPVTPGWSWAQIYIHLDQRAGGGANFVTSNGIPGSVVAGLNARADVLVEGVTYTSPTPVLGGQAGISLLAAPGNLGVGINASLTGPLGNTISGSKFDNRMTVSDVFYQGTLKWNQGVHNELVYVAGNIPSGTYDPNRLANLSFGFGAVDAGVGYTYLDPKTGHEFSVVGGLTYSAPNAALQYQNGIDAHLDWAASQFISKSVHVGVAGYYFQQLTADSGPGATLGPFKGMAVGLGPQIGFLFPVGDMQGYLNVKGYADLETENRPKGWSTWVTFVLSPKAPEPPPAAKPIVRKY